MRFEVDSVLGWDGDEENVVNFVFSPWTLSVLNVAAQLVHDSSMWIREMIK